MTKDGPRGDHQGWSTRVDRILARVPGWPTVKHADLPERQNDAVSNRLQIAFYYFFSDFFLLFFLFLVLEREGLPLSLHGDSRRCPSAVVAADVRRASVVSGDENGTDGQIETTWFQIWTSYCPNLFPSSRIWENQIRKNVFFSFFSVVYVCCFWFLFFLFLGLCLCERLWMGSVDNRSGLSCVGVCLSFSENCRVLILVSDRVREYVSGV